MLVGLLTSSSNGSSSMNGGSWSSVGLNCLEGQRLVVMYILASWALSKWASELENGGEE